MQSVDPVAGWSTYRSPKGGRLQSRGFYDGPVADDAELAPNGGTKRGRIVTNIYSFAGHAKPIHLACRYAGSDIVLSRALPAGVRQCTITSDAMSPAASADQVTCR